LPTSLPSQEHDATADSPPSESGLGNLLQDALDFISANRFVIERFPLQIYASGLLFSPPSIIRDVFKDDLPEWVTVAGVNSLPKRWHRSRRALEGPSQELTCLAVSRGEGHDWIVAGYMDQSIAVWNKNSLTPLRHIQEGDPVLRYLGTPVELAFSHDGNCLAACGQGRSIVTILEWRTGQLVATLEVEDYSPTLHFSPDDQSLFICTSSDLFAWTIGEPTARSWPIVGMAHGWAEDASLFLTTNKKDASQIEIWDMKSFEKVLLNTHQDCIQELAISHDHRLVAITVLQLPVGAAKERILI
jgi:hypothetical protein